MTHITCVICCLLPVMYADNVCYLCWRCVPVYRYDECRGAGADRERISSPATGHLSSGDVWDNVVMLEPGCGRATDVRSSLPHDGWLPRCRRRAVCVSRFWPDVTSRIPWFDPATLYKWCTAVSATLKYDQPGVENVTRAIFSTSGWSYFNVARTTVLDLFCRMS